VGGTVEASATRSAPDAFAEDSQRTHSLLLCPAQPTARRVTIKSVGDHSAGLRSLALGTRVIAEGPYGSLTAGRRSRRRVLLWAGGVGITPLRALLEALPAVPGDLTLIYRVGRGDDVIFAEELRVLAERRGATVHVVAGHRPAGGGDLLDPAGVARLVPDVDQRDVYLCGPPGMVAAARRTLSALGVPGRRIHSEDFGL